MWFLIMSNFRKKKIRGKRMKAAGAKDSFKIRRLGLKTGRDPRKIDCLCQYEQSQATGLMKTGNHAKVSRDCN